MIGPVEDPFRIPGYVREPGHHDGLQGLQEVQSVMIGPVEDPFAGPPKYISPGGCESSTAA